MNEINILHDLYWFFKVVALSAFISCVVVFNVLIAFRISFFYKSYRDPIDAIKRQSHPIKDVIENQNEYEKMNGV
jgi:hypothetical protein